LTKWIPTVHQYCSFFYDVLEMAFTYEFQL
jgi:hypothetical protein